MVVENGFATAGLQEGFFSNYGGRSADEVRPFMHRAPGTSWNAPKTVQVSTHTLCDCEVGDIGFMPTVTIVREMNAHSTWHYCATAAAVANTSAGIGRCNFQVNSIGFSPLCWT